MIFIKMYFNKKNIQEEHSPWYLDDDLYIATRKKKILMTTAIKTNLIVMLLLQTVTIHLSTTLSDSANGGTRD